MLSDFRRTRPLAMCINVNNAKAFKFRVFNFRSFVARTY